MKIVHATEARFEEVEQPGKIGHVQFHNYLGQRHAIKDGPQAYLAVQCDPGSEIYPHFHDVDQFQIFVGGGGRIGANAAEPVTVQYADAFSPYGPIIAGERDIAYFTFRLSHATGGWRMPGHRHLMPKRPGRNITCRFDGWEQALPAGKSEMKSLFLPQQDALAVIALRLGPEQRHDITFASRHGAYLLVCRGSATVASDLMQDRAIAHVTADDLPLSVVAGADGVSLLYLSFGDSRRQASSTLTQADGSQADYAGVKDISRS